MADSLQSIFIRFEALLGIEKKMMASLNKFEDHDDPVTKLEAETIVEDELLPRTSALLNTLSGVASYEQIIRDQKNNELEKSSMRLRILISLLSVTLIFIGIFLSLYMSRVLLIQLIRSGTL